MYALKHLRAWFGAARDRRALSFPECCSSDIRASALSSVGRVRFVNEDVAVFCRPVDPRDFEERGALALVADGMGGAQGGSVASEIVARMVPKSFLGSGAAPPVALRKALESASKEIYRRSQREQDLKGMGATCIVLVVKPTCAWAAWVGDSRLYLVRNGQIFQMTEDHSFVNEMVRRGLISREEAFHHKDRNIVTRALGSRPKVEIALWNQPFPVRLGDRFLLCSDGLHDLLSSTEILKIVSNDAVEIASSRLIEEANLRGGYDNVSAVLLELANSGSAAPRRAPQTREFQSRNLSTT